MNRIYRCIWSAARACFVAVSEQTSARGKSHSTGGTPLLRRAALALALCAAWPAHAGGPLPTGGRITAGAGSIDSAGTVLTVHQATDRLVTDWQSFSIGEGHTVRFVQPSSSSVALNRVLGSDASTIAGSLRANGQVFLVNPAGVLFAPGAQVDVGGLVASTLDIRNEDFLAGRYQFSGDSAASVVNQGRIAAAEGGAVALVAARIVNTGSIATPGGSTLLGAGSEVTLDFGGPVQLKVERGALQALIDQGGLIQADGGLVYLSARDAGTLARTVINHTGITEARTLATGKDGRIVLLGGMENDRIEVGGRLDASAPEGGNGGFVETSAADVRVADTLRVTTQAAQGRTGTWLIDPNDYTIAASGGNITGAALGSQLATTDVTISTATQGTPGGNGDIFVKDSVGWAANKLTLSAERDIHIDAPLNASGTAGLALEYGQGSTAAGNTAAYYVGAPVNLAATGSFSTKLGSDGAVTNYTIITSLGAENSNTGTDLQGMRGNLGGHYVLGADIDASATAGWSAGFVPVGGYSSRFTGTLDGLNHVVSNLDSHGVLTGGNIVAGLFGMTDTGATVRNVGLENVNVSVNAAGTPEVAAGGLVGYNLGTISQSYATGQVQTTGTAPFDNVAGVLVGRNFGSISRSYADGTASAGPVTSRGVSAAGVLVGYDQEGGTIEQSYASGNAAAAGGGSLTGAGSLVGVQWGGTLTNNFWNTDAMATGVGVSYGSTTGATGKTLAQLQQLSTFSSWGSTIDAQGGTGSVWRIYEGHTTPLLRGFLTPLTVQPAYDGSGAALANIGAYTLPAGADASLVQGSSNALTLSGSAAGSYQASLDAAALYSTQRGYDLTVSPCSIATPGTAAGDIRLDDAVSWTSGTLTLSAERDIHIDAPLNASGTAGLALEYGQGSTAAGNTAAYYVGAPVNLAATGSFSTKLGSDGAVTNYTIITSLGAENSTTGTDLQGMRNDLAGHYVLGADIDASATAGWSAGFVPVGGYPNMFTGTLDGLNHVVSNLDIHAAGGSGGIYAGLFGVAGNGAVVRNVGLENVNVSVNAAGSTEAIAGGLVGVNYGGTIFQSFATGNVQTTGVSGSNVAGVLVGVNDGSISRSYATGTASAGPVGSSGYSAAGVLVGGLGGTIEQSYASGNAAAAGGGSLTGAGSLVGVQWAGTLTNNFWNTDAMATGVGSGDNTGATGKTLAQLQQLSTFSAWGNTIDAQAGTGSVWRIYEGQTTPLLRGFLKPLTVTVNDGSMVYNGSTVASGASDVLSDPGATVLGTASYVLDEKNVGTHSVAVTGLYSDQRGYDIRTVAGSYDVTPASLAVTGVAADDKTYDGTTAANLSGTAGLAGVFGSDDVSLGGSAAASFADKNVGSGKAVTVSGYTLSGADAGNYTLSQPAGLVASITPRTLTVTASGQDKVYDGTTTANVALSDDRVASDALTLSGTGSFFTKNVGSGIEVDVNGIALGGADAGNYVLGSTTARTTASITPRTLHVTATGLDKVYDGGVGATVILGDDGVAGDELILHGIPLFRDKNAGTNKAVVVNAIGLTGADAGNYVLANTFTTTTADITPRTLHVTATGVDKVYDGGVGAAVNWGDDRVLGDALTFSGTASFADKNAGTGKTVGVTGIALGGADSGNYVLASTTASTSADITPRTLHVTATGVDKVYDGGVGAAVNWGDDRVGGDALSFSGTASFADKNVGTGKAVGVTGIALGGADAGNYVLDSTTATTTADITPRTLHVTATGQDKVYDGTTAATVSLSDDRVANDALAVSGSANFGDKNAGTDKAVDVSGIALSGADAGNYVLASTTATTDADITPRTLHVGASAQDKVYDGTTAAVASYSDDRLAGDLLTVTGQAAFADPNAGRGKTVTATGLALSGADAGNYSLAQPVLATTASITPRPLDFIGTRLQDGTAVFGAGQLTATNVLAGDTVQLTGQATVAGAQPGRYGSFAANQLASGNANYSVSGGSVALEITPAVPASLDALLAALQRPQGERPQGERPQPSGQGLRLQIVDHGIRLPAGVDPE